MTLPRRLMTPRTKSGVRGTRVIGSMPMISLHLEDLEPVLLVAEEEGEILAGLGGGAVDGSGQS